MNPTSSTRVCQVRIAADLSFQFRRIAAERGETRAGLLMGFAREAHRRAATGQRLPGRTPGRGPAEKWRWGVQVHADAEAALQARGSTLTWALRGLVAEYVAAEGNPAAPAEKPE